MLVKAKVKDLNKLSCLKSLNVGIGEDRSIEGIYCGDLLSDCLASAKQDHLLLTIQNHKNVAAVAILKQLSCIVLSKQIQASEEMLNLCSENDIAVFQSSEDSFTTAILLYELLK